MNDNDRREFEALLRLKSDEELHELLAAQGLIAEDDANREKIIALLISDDSVPEAERADLSG